MRDEDTVSYLFCDGFRNQANTLTGLVGSDRCTCLALPVTEIERHHISGDFNWLHLPNAT
jgi:hypothetical protein